MEWFSVLGYLVGAACIARQLGAGRLGQILTVVAAVSLPMGIVQASSAMVDAVLTFWVICAAAEALALLKGAPAGQVVPFASLAAGLAALTKPNAVAYVLPVGIFLGLILLRKAPRLQLLKWSLVALLLVCAINAGYLIRNYDLYGTPFGGPFGEHANGLMAPAGVISNLLRNTALQIGLPWGPPDRLVYDAIIQVHHWLKLDPNDPRTTSVGFFKPIVASTSEQRPTNPLHALLIAVSFCFILLGQTRFGRRHLSRDLSSSSALAYTLTVASTFLIFSILFQWQIFGSRYLMPFFVLFAPVIGLVLAELLPLLASRLAGLLLIAAAVPILVSIETRPLIPIPGHAIVRSVLIESPHRLLLAGGLYLVKPYEDITNRIKDVNCSQVGLMLRGADAEYPLWAWLGLPRQPRQIEWIATGPSTRYAVRDFQPCAIICERCQEKTFEGLPLDYEYDIYQLYLKVR